MLPHQRNKVDLSTLTAEEQRLFSLYGKLPSKKDILKNKLKERKYFDSGDYALSKAGKASDVGVTNIGVKHPLPENIPHIHNNSQTGENGSPVKEGSHLHSSPMASEEPISAESVEAEYKNDDVAEATTEGQEDATATTEGTEKQKPQE